MRNHIPLLLLFRGLATKKENFALLHLITNEERIKTKSILRRVFKQFYIAQCSFFSCRGKAIAVLTLLWRAKHWTLTLPWEMRLSSFLQI